MTDLSIIILSYNTSELTLECTKTTLASLDKDPQINAEVIVWDNNSTDTTTSKLKKIKDTRLKVIEHKENLGYTGGNNNAAKIAKGSVLLFLNSDIIVLEDAIPRMYRFFTAQKGFNFLGARLLNKDRSPQASCGRFYTLPVAFFALFLKGDSWGASRWAVRKIQKVDWASGAALMTSKETFEKLNGFDDSLFMYWDEIDLLYRAHRKKMVTGVYPDAAFIHLEGASSSSRTQPILKVFQGYMHFYKKHYSPLQQTCILYMLQLKAIIAFVIGKVSGNDYLLETYRRAYETIKKA